MSVQEGAPTRRPKHLSRLAAWVLFLSAAPTASAQTPVVFGDTITEPGLYFLAGNQSGAGDGIAIESDDVTLLLLRFTLRGDGTHFGIKSHGYDNVTIWGGRVTNFQTGIVITDGDDCTVRDTRIDASTGPGLVAVLVRDSAFLRLRCDHNSRDGVDARECLGSRFVSILAHDNGGNGIALNEHEGFAGVPEVTGSKVRQCWAAYNDLDGIRVRNSNHHEIVSNQCVNNGEAGIRLFTFVPTPTESLTQALVGPRDVQVKSNWCVFNRDGIVVDKFALSDTLTNNTSLANSGHDMIDDNDQPPCVNTWFLNFFLSKDGEGDGCIF